MFAYLPVPVRLTIRALFAASSSNVNAPFTMPFLVGENFVTTEHFAPRAIIAPQVLLDMTKLALAVMLTVTRLSLRRRFRKPGKQG